MNNNYIELICEVFSCNKTDISDIKENSGMTNKSYSFVIKNKDKYLIRIPGKGANDLVNRHSEFEAYAMLKDTTDICDEVVYLNQDTGVKISKFIENGHKCDLNNVDEISACIKTLKKFHLLKLKTNYTFDLEFMLRKYENLMEYTKYEDYAETRKRCLDCIKFIRKLNRKKQLCHIDPNYENFFVTDNKVYLLDWEYASMQDPLLDVAMFAIYAGYDKDKILWLTKLYCGNQYNADILNIVYAYCAIAGLIWSNWCEYKEHLGQDFGDYALSQYNYAKEFSKIVKK